MIRLFAENPEWADPNLTLRWCVDQETLGELKEKGIKNPQLLLVVVQHPGQWGVKEIERKLIPLGQAMEGLEFNRPGRYTIYTTVVWDDDNSWDFEVEWLLRRDKDGFRWRMFNCDGRFSHTRSLSVKEHSLDEGSLDVVVAKELFAKEPPAWLNWWVNFWFIAMEISRPTNQCSFRRRAILAFTVQPIPVFIWVLLKSLTRLVAAVVLVLWGHRGVSFKPIIHPFKLCLGNVWYDMGSSVFLEDKHGKRRSLVFIPITPIFPVILFTILFIASMFFHFGFWLAVMGTVGLIVGALVLILLAYSFNYVAGLVIRGLRTIWRALVPPPSAEKSERRRKRREQELAELDRKRLAERDRKKREEQEQEQRRLEAFYKGLQDVVCIGVPLKPKLELLPEKRRTIYLRYMDLKAKVCKPYARR